jgi:hypothetical protein
VGEGIKRGSGLKVLCAAVFLLLASASLQAGVISLETRVNTNVQESRLDAAVTVTNHGNESAFNLQVKSESLGSEQESSVQKELPVEQSYTATFRYALKGLSPGLYPLVLRILYTDANLYPLSALAISGFVWQKNAPPGILGILGVVRIQDQGRLNLRLKNLDNDTKTLHLRLLLPRELTAESLPSEMELPANKEVRLPFQVRNFSALENSIYPVYAVIEYDQRGLHYTAVAPGTIRIGSVAFLSRHGNLLLVAFVVLLAYLVWINVRARSKRK